MEWNPLLLEQLTWHWDHHVRRRLEGLSDDEYLWEPAAGMWSLRRRDDARTAMAAGAGEWVLDYEHPAPEPDPPTTIAWRLAHVVIVFGERCANHFGGPPMSYQSVDWPPTAAGALNVLEECYERWVTGVRSLGEDGLGRAVGAAEGPFAEYPYAALVLHIHREAIHHLAEVAVLRDLYAHRV